MTDGSLRGNFISEWFGYRTYPLVHAGTTALQVRREGRCPFLTAVTRSSQDCVKASSSSGVCTINNASNGSRQDWLVCPYRALDPDLIESVVRRLFEAEPGQSVMAIPAPAITRQETRDELLDHAQAGGVTVVYLQNRLGGEISVKATARSPELSFDYTSWFLWPTFSFQVYPGNVLNTYIWHAVDHRTTRVTRQWFAPDGAAPELLESLAEQDLRTTVAEDVRLVESVQRGLESGGYRPSPLVIDPAGGVNSEHSIRMLYEWLGEAMA